MAAFIMSRKLKKASLSLIMFNLSIAHLYVSGGVNTFALIGLIRGEQFFKYFPFFCSFSSAACFITGLVAFQNLALLSFDR